MNEKKGIWIGIILILIIITIVIYQLYLVKEVPPEKYCEMDTDCVPNKCCHPTELINMKYAPVCDEDNFCSIAIEDVTKMDTKSWKPLCQRGICEVQYE